MAGTADLFNIANAAPPVVGSTGPGAISGGLLRPGAIDQQAFQQMLRAQQSARAAAGVGGKPVGMPILPFQNGIPTLTSAQFAALVGDQTPEAADSDDTGLAADPRAAMQPADPTLAARVTALGAPASMLPQALPQSRPGTAALRLSGRPSPAMSGVDATGAATQPTLAAAIDASGDGPQIFRGPAGVRAVGESGGEPGGSPQAASAQAPPATAGTPLATDPADGKPAAADAQNPAPSNPDLVHLKEQPDRDMQMKLRLEHKQWVVDETPGSRELFFGADGKFGWDDFLDVINPLQHIPIISQIYRAITGDQINGAAELIGAIPFGPLGFLGMAGAIADLAVKDATGKDIGGNVEAMILGNDAGSTDNMAAKPGAGSPDDAVVAGGAGPAPVQTAALAGPATGQRAAVESERLRRG